jgi:hypothetical protein
MLDAHMIVKAFWINLVLYVDASGPSTLKYSYGVDDMGGLTVPRAGIDYYGNIYCSSHPTSDFCDIF